MPPSVIAEPAPGWTAIDVAPPKIATSAGAELTQWTARGGAGSETVLVGCVATPIPGWVEDMRPAIVARTTAFAGASAERVVGVPIDARPDGTTLVLRPASDLAGPPVGIAKTFVGFDAGHVFTCFAICARPIGAERTASARACDPAVTSARLEGDAPPPKPGAALASVTWAVHHPQHAGEFLGALVAIASVLAIVTRRRPRTGG